jgi:hypothetical protein
MKKKILRMASIMIATAIFSIGSFFISSGECGDVDNAECYSFENGKSCLPLWEPGAGNCNDS